MEYLYCEDGNFEDFSSGRVLYSGSGIPNFPVRLLNEIFGRALSYSEKTKDVTVYDPCCGGGYALTVLGFFYNESIQKIYGSDISPEMVSYAKKNVSLLGREGLEQRKAELAQYYELYGKESHRSAIDSCSKLSEMLQKEIPSEVFEADCTKPLPEIAPDLMFVDIPYGNLVEWEDASIVNTDEMLEQLWRIAKVGTVLAVCMDKKQKCHSDKWVRLEKQNIGKRRFEIYKKGEK